VFAAQLWQLLPFADCEDRVMTSKCRLFLTSLALAVVAAGTLSTGHAQTYDPFLYPYGPYGPNLPQQQREREQRYRQNELQNSSRQWNCKAANRSTGATGWSTNYNSRQGAVNRALRECGQGCRITHCH
jgi:hypothetical protein